MSRILASLLFSLSILFALQAPLFAASDEPQNGKLVKIGVVAFRGSDRALKKWSPTADYLAEAIPGHRFEIVPLTLTEITRQVRERTVDFVLTNTGSYVELEARQGITRIATLNTLQAGEARNVFGGVIFVRADREDITSIADFRGRRFMAVSKKSFGGFQMAWRELNDAGIDPFSDLSELLFSGFPQDSVVFAVRDGVVDAGTVRTGILESMAAEGKIDLGDFKILKSGNHVGISGFPLAVSTRLYPEWAFAKTRHASSELARQVALKLLEMPRDHSAAVDGGYGGWTIPVSYQPAHDLFRELRIGPYQEDAGVTLRHMAEEHWYLIVFAVLALAAVFAYAFVLRRIAANRSRQLTEADRDLQVQQADRKRAEVVSARFGRILEDSANEIFIFDASTLRFVQVNRGARENLGYTMAELEKLTAYDIKPYYDLSSFQEAVKPLRDGTENLLTFETVHERKDGSTYDVEVRLQLHRDNGGSLFVAIVQDITDRKRALEISNRFGRILEDSSNEIYIFDSENLRFVQVNRGARENLGYTMAELEQLTAYDIKPEYDWERFEEAVRPLRDGIEDLLTFETVHERKDGSTYSVEVQLQLYRENKTSLFVAIIQDISGRKRAEEISSRFGRILENSSNEIYIFDPESLLFVQVNRGARENLGYTMAELEQITAYDIKPDYDLERFQQAVAPLRRGAESLLTFETVHERKDGSTYPVEVRLQLYRENKTSLFVAIIQDISERKRAESALQNRNRLLGVISDAQQHFIGMADENEVFGTLLNGFVNMTGSEIGFIAAVLESDDPAERLQVRSTHNVTWGEESLRLGDQNNEYGRDLFGPDSIFGDVVVSGEPALENDAGLAGSGKPPPRCCPGMKNFMGVPIHLGQQLIGVVGLANQGRPYEWTELVQLEPLISTSGHLLEAWRSAERRIEAENEIRKLNAELEERVATRTSELRATNDNLHETLGNLQQTQEQLVQSEKMASLGGLVAGVAHEINTPLGIGVTAASHLRQASADLQQSLDGGNLRKADLEKFLQTSEQSTDIILTNLRRAADLIRSFKQVAVDQSSEEMRVFALRSYLDEVLLSLRPNLKRTKHKIEVDCPEDLSVTSFPGAISQIVTNLVMNSVLHAYGEGDQGQIRISANERRGRIELVYSDDGKGIPEENLKQIYDPFFTTARNRGGSGLGLNILYNIVTQKLGGTIRCNSSSGNGVEFIISFPVALGAVA